MGLRLLIAAGGTGGHILPAVALGEALSTYHKEVEFRYLCGERPLERELYAQNAIEPIVLPARQVGRGISGKLQGFGAALGNTFRAMALLRREKFDAVIGMGGYVTGPAVLAGVLLGRKTAIHEANSIPGKTNRYLAPWVDLCAVHFPVTGRLLRSKRVLVCGMPIRQSFSSGCREQGQKIFGLSTHKRTLLISGGSQGAKYLYATLMSALPQIDTPENEDLQILWSTGTGNYEELNRQLQGVALQHLTVKLIPFIKETNHAFAAADVALARAGASTIAEFLASGLFALYVPLPSAIYDHQTLNAREVVKLDAGEMIAEKELSAARVGQAVRSLLEKARLGKRLEMRSELDSRHAARTLADALCGLI